MKCRGCGSEIHEAEFYGDFYHCLVCHRDFDEEEDNMYKIEELADAFEKHAMESKKVNDALVKDFSERYPGQELPAHLRDNFSLPGALSVMCRAIIDVNNSRLKPEAFS
jgi:hypothetical protein